MKIEKVNQPQKSWLKTQLSKGSGTQLFKVNTVNALMYACSIWSDNGSKLLLFISY